MLDLLLTNATLPDGRTGLSVAVEAGRIVEVTPGLAAAVPGGQGPGLNGNKTSITKNEETNP